MLTLVAHMHAFVPSRNDDPCIHAQMRYRDHLRCQLQVCALSPALYSAFVLWPVGCFCDDDDIGCFCVSSFPLILL
jgi:hypothetical protein